MSVTPPTVSRNAAAEIMLELEFHTCVSIDRLVNTAEHRLILDAQLDGERSVLALVAPCHLHIGHALSCGLTADLRAHAGRQ